MPAFEACVQLGYRYDTSPVIVPDGTPATPVTRTAADPRPGRSYRQEYYKGVAEDKGAIVSVGEERVEVPFGFFGEDVLMTRDLEPLEPKVQELKFYAPGVGPTSMPIILIPFAVIWLTASSWKRQSNVFC